MKKSIYDKLEDIPQIDRDENNYALSGETDPSKPTYGKYVLILDGGHPIQAKNTELLIKESQRETEKQAAIQAAVGQKDTEIQRISAELAIAKTQTGVPTGQVAVPAEKVQVLQSFESLGKFEEVKAKVEEHSVLKEQTESTARKELFADVAKVEGFEPEAFATLAEQQKLHEKLEKREVPDAKKPTEKVTHYFVKDKDAAGAETSVVVGDFVKNNDFFKPFLPALQQQQQGGGTRRKVPDMGVGDPPVTQEAGKSYVNSKYKLPAKQNETGA